MSQHIDRLTKHKTLLHLRIPSKKHLFPLQNLKSQAKSIIWILFFEP